MFGVLVIYFVRKLKEPFISESLSFLILTAILFYFVSVPSVLSNMQISGDFYHYFIMAFSKTEFLVQTILVLGCITVLLLAYNLAFLTTRLTVQLKHRFA